VIIIAVYSLAVLFFCIAFFHAKIIETSRQVLAIANNAIAIFSNDRLDDLARERAIQKFALNMVTQTLMLISKVLITLLFTALPVWLASTIKLVSPNDIGQFAMRWDVIFITTSIIMLPFIMYGRKIHSVDNKTNESDSTNSYSLIDRVTHNLVFRSNTLQEILGDIEHTFFSKTWENAKVDKPIFITSLPRAGTTIMLESLSRLPGLATHTYRDMPFILTPVLWSKLSQRFHNQSIKRERAHGDGLLISEDSPEAFEEVLWIKYFPEHYSSEGIVVWSTGNVDFRDYFHEHLRKIISLRLLESASVGHYVSKNNANIARIKVIKSIFPDAVIIVPLRDPVEQSISLWQQHHNFLNQHATKEFIYKYMEDIGHYEFGQLHRPILFPSFDALRQDLSPEDLGYWLAYWISAYEYLSEQQGINFLSYETLCKSGNSVLTILCEHLKLSVSEQEIENAARVFHLPTASRRYQYDIDAMMIKRADELYNTLKGRCLYHQEIIS